METDKQHLSAEAFSKIASIGTEKKLSKHIQAAVNQLEKQIEKYHKEIHSLEEKVSDIETSIGIRKGAIKLIEEQIKRLKGE